jgi:hypothetical protein
MNDHCSVGTVEPSADSPDTDNFRTARQDRMTIVALGGGALLTFVWVGILLYLLVLIYF